MGPALHLAYAVEMGGGWEDNVLQPPSLSIWCDRFCRIPQITISLLWSSANTSTYLWHPEQTMWLQMLVEARDEVMEGKKKKHSSFYTRDMCNLSVPVIFLFPLSSWFYVLPENVAFWAMKRETFLWESCCLKLHSHQRTVSGALPRSQLQNCVHVPGLSSCATRCLTAHHHKWQRAMRGKENTAFSFW